METFLDKLKENFNNPLIQILIIALGIIFVLAYFNYAEWLEGLGIAVAIVIATFVSTYSEYKNELSFQKLQHEASLTYNTVFRNGFLQKTNIIDIVVGDYVLLQAGDKIPADGIVVSGEIGVNQAVLNGEAEPVIKKAISNNQQIEINNRDLANPYMVFRGTVVDEGEATIIVQKVGINTLFGELFNELSTPENRESPLQVKLEDFANKISKIGYYGAIFIAFSFLFKKVVIDNGYSMSNITDYLKNWQVALKDVMTSFILAVIIIVVAVPEGLPMMIANVLSQNMNKLLEKNVLVRKLLGIETAGSMNLLFVDKTGTITMGKFKPFIMCEGSGKSFFNCSEIPSNLQSILTFALQSPARLGLMIKEK